MNNRNPDGMRSVYTIAADDAEWLAYDAKGILSGWLIVRCFTAVLNRGRGADIALPLSDSERELINTALDNRLSAKKDGTNEPTT